MVQLAESLNRLGTETAFEVLARAGALQAEGRDIINLGIGQPDFKTPGHIVEAAVKALRDGEHGYTPAQGIPALREAVAKDLAKRHDVTVNPDNIVIMPGGKPTMFFSILMFGTPGTEVMYPDPGFPIYRSMIEFNREEQCEKGCLLANVTNEMGGLSEKISEDSDRHFKLITGLLAKCINEGQVKNEITGKFEAHALADFIHNGFNGALLRAKAGRSTEPMELFITMVIQMIKIRH